MFVGDFGEVEFEGKILFYLVICIDLLYVDEV